MQGTPQQQIIDKCKAVVEKAKTLYGVDLSNVRVSFDLKGRCAGVASMQYGQYMVRFNRDMLTREAFDHVLNDTVPHEYAHIVCFMNPRLGRNHDYGWANVCRQLGGSGGRCHSEEVVYGKGTTYEYVTDRGHKVRLSDKLHKKVRAGQVLRYRKGLGNVSLASAYTIVGMQGRSINNAATVAPVQPTAPVAPVAPVAPRVEREHAGETKANKVRRIMRSGYQEGKTYEEILNAMMLVTGHTRSLSRSYFKFNAAKCGIPESFII